MSSSTESLEFNNAIFEASVPVLLGCFGLILLGFIAARLNLLTNMQANGLGSYATAFALPAIFFNVMVSTDFSDVDWHLVLAVSLGKIIVFFCTMALVLLFSLGKSFGLAGLLAIFVSQTNDIALSYPVLRVFYPDLASYTYLFAPTQLVILNPLGFFALEWHRSQEKNTDFAAAPLASQSIQSVCILIFKRILKVTRLVASNPLFFMTALGVIFNFILKHKLPVILHVFFNDLGTSFNATALFYLGFSMVGKLRRIERRGVYVLVFILIGKAIFSPFITREVTMVLTAHQPGNVSLSKSNFAFLYAAAPSAPSVFLFASQFGVVPEVIGAGLVIGTFLYAPTMFLLGGVITLVNVDPQYYDSTLERAGIYISWISIFCCTWVLIVLLVAKKACRMPYRFLLCLIISVMTFCTTLAIGSIWAPNSRCTTSGVTWGQYIQFVIFFIACTASRVWTAFLSVAILIQVRYNRLLSSSICLLFYALGLSIPIVVTSILMVTSGNVSNCDINPAFHYGKVQQTCSLVVLCVCLSISLLAILCAFRPNINLSGNAFLSNSVGDERRPLISVEEDTMLESSNSVRSPILSSDVEIRHKNHIFRSRDQIETNGPPEPDMISSQRLNPSGTASFHRFFLLIVLLMISMFFGVCVCIWRLARKTEASFFIAMEFLDQVFNFGQGILIFSIFGIDTDIIINPLRNCISALRLWVMNSLPLSSFRTAHRLKEEEVELFVANQLPICMQQICSSIRLSGKTLDSVFYFSDFHQWINQRLAIECRQQSCEDTKSMLMALATRGLIRRLGTDEEGLRSAERVETPNSPLPSSSATLSRSLFHHANAVEPPILFQFLAST